MSPRLHLARILIVVLAGASSSHLSAQTPRVADVQVDVREDSQLQITLDVSGSRFVPGENVAIQIKFVNAAENAVEVFDPFLDSLLDRHAVVLAIQDDKGKMISDLLKRYRGSFRSPVASHWICIPTGGTISSTHSFSAGTVPGDFDLKSIPPGTYYLQAIIYKHVVTPAPVELATDEAKDRGSHRTRLADWRATFPGQEVYRSNRVKIELLAPAR